MFFCQSGVWAAAQGSGGDTVKSKLAAAGIVVPANVPDGIICKPVGNNANIMYLVFSGYQADYYLYSSYSTWGGGVTIAYNTATLIAATSTGIDGSCVCYSTVGTWVSAITATLTSLASM